MGLATSVLTIELSYEAVSVLLVGKYIHVRNIINRFGL